jgi:hypothetical protein
MHRRSRRIAARGLARKTVPAQETRFLHENNFARCRQRDPKRTARTACGDRAGGCSLSLSEHQFVLSPSST